MHGLSRLAGEEKLKYSTLSAFFLMDGLCGPGAFAERINETWQRCTGRELMWMTPDDEAGAA